MVMPSPLLTQPPLIGLTSRIDRTRPEPYIVLRAGYTDAIRKAGGIPWVLPVLPEDQYPEWMECLDALILTGGEDVNPLLFGQQPQAKLGRVDTDRDLFELSLARQWLRTGKPLFAVCRGIQLLQIAAGGVVLQDIATAIPQAIRHEQKGLRRDPAHTVEILPDTTLSLLLDMTGSLEVNSIHHQAVESPAKGFRVAARACDGVIEAIEAEDNRLVLGVQWHPEEMESPVQQQLFQAFVKAVSLHRNNRAAPAHREEELQLA